jgi:hypothetical protein
MRILLIVVLMLLSLLLVAQSLTALGGVAYSSLIFFFQTINRSIDLSVIGAFDGAFVTGAFVGA